MRNSKMSNKKSGANNNSVTTENIRDETTPYVM